VRSARPHKAIILAAGQGTRLGELTSSLPKCLLDINGKSILRRQIESLQHCGVREFVIVTGFGADQVRGEMGPGPTYVHNADYAATNSLYSFYAAREEARDGFVLLNGDVVFHRDIAQSLLASPYADAAAVDFRDGLGDEETKVKVNREQIVAITKDMDPDESDGENVGLLKFGAPGAARLLAKAETLLANGAERAWVIAAFHALAAEHPLYAIPTDARPWIEVDFVEDLRAAREQVAPRCNL